MKKISLFIFIAFFLASVVSTTPQGFVHAQDPECHDAAGGVIPCPPTEEIPCGQTGGPECPPTEEIPCGQAGGPACSPASSDEDNDNEKTTPVPPTKTPLAIANPAGDAELAGSEWSGSCALTDLKCPLAFSNGCKHVGGSWEVVSTSETDVTLKCTVPLVIEPTPFPFSAAATATPQPEEDYLGQCTKADGDFFECKEKFTCEDGLLVMKVDLYSGNGTVYDFYCYPHKPNLSIAAVPGNNATENWTGDCNSYNSHGNLSSCLDQYAAACAQEGGDYSEWYDDDGSAGVYCQNESEASQSMPIETALPAAVPADSGPTPPSGGLPWLWLTIGGVVGALLLPAVQKVREAAASSHSSLPPTREHILLNKDNNGTKTGFIKSDGIDSEEDPKAEIKVVYDLKSNPQPDEPSTAHYKLKDVLVSSIKSNEQDPKQEDQQLRSKRSEADSE